ncbi:hypothetical protein D8Y22_02555 [Salinadaptatus halalkaliphilus]|uniref:Uncharacterized protein n=1 Tax=Salinadaptatus halalkaliphilus TaxID=2419781 RepID=A0A4S3TUV7_9EURY|nr:hypothetical protein [Salinadaptatus halalkaliphilus]THE66458.1 hypothetical protein D8Y22_02555 [Salinadaptatus halalkaliphilus]
MNRRTVLQSASAVGLLSLAGCLSGVQEHFEGNVQGIVPLEIHSEADSQYNIQLEAYERETNRQSYDEGYSVTPGETVGPPHLSATDQSFRVTTLEPQSGATVDSQEVSITSETQLVLIYIQEDDLVIDVDRGEQGETIDDPDELADRNESDGDDEDGL